MRGWTVAGAGLAAVICCAAVPLTVGITGWAGAAAFGANAGVLVVAAGALLLFSFLWPRLRGPKKGSDG
jgi:hypothetical protein